MEALIIYFYVVYERLSFFIVVANIPIQKIFLWYYSAKIVNIINSHLRQKPIDHHCLIKNKENILDIKSPKPWIL